MPASASPARVIALRCEQLEHPLGLDEATPRFSWQLRDERHGARQTACEIRVGSAPGRDDAWSSGRRAGGRSLLVPYAGAPLMPHTRYFWSVRIWDHNGNASPWSLAASWRTGFLGQTWPADWIGLPVRRRHQSTPVRYLRVGFDLPSVPVSAFLHITALGTFEAYANGARIGSDVLAPGWTDYRRRTEYLTYDLADRLVVGRNVLAALLADGWYCGRLVWHGQRRLYGTTPALKAVLRVTFADGTVRTIGTNRNWKAATGAFLAADLYDGEEFDARLEPEGWTSAEFDDASWRRASVIAVPAMAIDAKQVPPIRPVEYRKAVALNEPQPGSFVFDLGQNMVGVVRLRVTAARGTRVQLRHGEMLNPDGTLYTANLRSARATDVYICRGGGVATYTPRFTSHGFRYVEVTGLPRRPELDAIEGVVLQSDLTATGRFTCSDRWINKLVENIRWGQRGNYLDLPTDCPQRDERLGWTGDAQIFLGTAACNYDVAAFFRKWLRDLRDGQHPDGSVPDVAPDAIAIAQEQKPEVWSAHAHHGNAAWADAIVICPWLIHQRYGDRRILEENYDAMKRWIGYVVTTSHRLIRPVTAYGDWLATDAVTPFRAPTPNDLVGTAYFAHSAGIVASVARLLGHERDDRRFSRLHQDVVAAFQREYLTPSGRIVGDTQTAYLLALAFDLLPERTRTKAVERLVHLIARNGFRLATGFVGTPLLCPVLTRFGRADVAYRLLFQPEYPSWLYPVQNGATTMWERWNSWTKETGFGDVGMNSFNHYAYGAVGEWIFATIGGIAPDPRHPAFRRFHLRLAPTTKVSSARARFASPFGEIRSEWRLRGAKLDWTFTIPAGTQASVHLPAKKLDGLRLNGNPVARSAITRTRSGEHILLPAGSYQLHLPQALVLPF